MRLLLSACALSLMAFASPAMAAPGFTDGFESPSQNGGYSYGSFAAAGGSFSAALFGSGAGLQANGSAFGYATAPQGVQTADIQKNGTITYSLNGLIAGATYGLSFFDAARTGINADSFTVSFNNAVIGLLTPAPNAFTMPSLNFMPGATSDLLVFAATIIGSDTDVGIDAVNISAVPEPVSWAMMVIGIGAVGFALRRREKSNIRGSYVV